MPYRIADSALSDVEEVLRAAGAAAEDRNAAEALEDLARCGFLDGMVRRIGSAYPRLDQDAAEDLVADGVGRLYCRILNQEKPPLEKPDGYLLKVVFGLAKSEMDRRREEDEAAREHERIDFEHDEDAPSRDVLREQAVRVARSLLPRIGHENAQRVMTVVLDSVQAEEPVSPTEIGHALELVPNTVSKLIERGIARLAREAKKEGLEMTIDYAMAIEEEFQDD